VGGIAGEGRVEPDELLTLLKEREDAARMRVDELRAELAVLSGRIERMPAT
jgi:hypothetical protein